MVDECGTLVPYAVSDMAKARNLKVTYGPRYGQFSVHAMGEGATRKSVDVHGVPCHDEYLPGQVLVPVEPASYATVPDRQELKELLMQFKSNDDKDLYGVTSKIDKPEPVPYLDMLILVFILINAASSTMEHFLGTPVDVLVDVPQGTDCCDAECLVSAWSQPRTPHPSCPKAHTRNPLNTLTPRTPIPERETPSAQTRPTAATEADRLLQRRRQVPPAPPCQTPTLNLDPI